MSRPLELQPIASTTLRSAHGGWYMVGLLTLVQSVSYIDRFLPSPVLPAIKRDLHLTDFQLGLLLGPAFHSSMSRSAFHSAGSLTAYPGAQFCPLASPRGVR